jgi:hypothetical protein
MKDDEEDDASGNGHIAEQHDHSNTNADNTSFHPTYAENDQFDNAYTGDDGGFIDNTHFENNSLDQQPLSAVKHSAILPSDISNITEPSLLQRGSSINAPATSENKSVGSSVSSKQRIAKNGVSYVGQSAPNSSGKKRPRAKISYDIIQFADDGDDDNSMNLPMVVSIPGEWSEGKSGHQPCVNAYNALSMNQKGLRKEVKRIRDENRTIRDENRTIRDENRTFRQELAEIKAQLANK